MIIFLYFKVVRKLNCFPVNEDLSPYYSPRTILDQQPLDYNKHCTIPFGLFVQANNYKNLTDSIFLLTIDKFDYYPWIKYKVDMRYLVYTVKELPQDGKLLKFKFLGQ